MDSRLTRNSAKNPQKNVRITKPSATDQAHYKTVKDSGIDVDGMTKTEIYDLAKVILLSKAGNNDNNEINDEESEGFEMDVNNDTKENKIEFDSTDSEDCSSQQVYVRTESTLREDIDLDNSVRQRYIPDESTLRDDIDSNEPIHVSSLEKQRLNMHDASVPSPRYDVEQIIDGSTSDEETQNYDVDMQNYTEKHKCLHRPSIKQKINLSKSVPQNERVSRESVVEIDNDEADTIYETPRDEQSHRKDDLESEKLPENTECTSDEELFPAPVKELIRHYRKKRNKICGGLTIYSSSINSPETCAKVIEQLFEIYHRKITLAQSNVQRYMTWGEPVKVGKHWNKTIDVKKRGTFIQFEESDEDVDDTKQSKPGEKRILDKKEENDVETDQSLSIKRKFPKLRKTRNSMPTESITKHTEKVGKYIPDFEDGNDIEMTEDIKTSKEIHGDINVCQERLDSGLEDCADAKYGENSWNNVAKIDLTLESNAKSNLSGKINRQRFRLEEDSEEEVELPDLLPSENNSQQHDQNSLQQKQSASFCKPDIVTSEREVEQKKLRKLYTRSEVKFLPSTEGLPRQDMDSQEAASSDVDKPKNETWNTQRYKRSRMNFKRNYSDLSVASTESGQSEEEFIKHLNGQQRREASPERPCSRGSESSVDRLSQSSALMFDPQGELYSTQFCVLKETSGSDTADHKSKVNRGFGGNATIQQDGSNIFQKLAKRQSLRSTNNSLNMIPKNSVVVELDESSSDGEGFLTLKKTKPAVKIMSDMDSRQDESTDEEVSFRKAGKEDEGESRVTHGGNSQQLFSDTLGRHRAEEKTALIDEDSKDGWLTATGPRAGNSKQNQMTYSRIRKKRPINEDETPQKKMKLQPPSGPSDMSCPLCFGKFRLDEIEAHAADCDGSAADNVAVDEGNQAGHMDSNQNITEDLERDADVSILEAEMSSSMESCYICDQSFPKGSSYEDHVNKCLKEATKLQKAADSQGYGILIEDEDMETKRTTRSKVKPINSKLHRGLDKAWSEIDGYSSGSGEENMNLKAVLQKNADSRSESESSRSDDNSSDDTIHRTPSKNQGNILPGGWTAEELDNSPIRTFVPIWHQKDSDGFKNQYQHVQRKYEQQLIKKKIQGKRLGNQMRGKKRKMKSKGNSKSKKRKICKK